jgi:hypothetical protein
VPSLNVDRLEVTGRAGPINSEVRQMIFTIVLIFVLIGSFAALFGVVKFAENIISRQQLAPVINYVPLRKTRRNNVGAKAL